MSLGWPRNLTGLMIFSAPAEIPGPLPAGEAEPGAAQPGPVPGHRLPRPSPLGQMVSQ